MNKKILFLSAVMVLFSCKGNQNNTFVNEIEREFEGSFLLNEVQSFGESTLEAEGDFMDMSGGGVLGRISDIKISNDNNLYILDSGLKKVVVYNEQNELEQVILGGYGSGPGEFRLPTALDLDYENNLYVYDYELQRVTMFNRDGELLTQFDAPTRSKSMVVTHEGLWLTNLMSRRYHTTKLDLYNTEAEAKNMISVQDEDLSHSPHGVASWVTQSFYGSTLVALGRPGIWYEIMDGEYHKRGHELIPNSDAYQIRGVWIEPAHTIGISSFGEDHVAIAWMDKMTQNQVTEVKSIWLEIFHKDGAHTDAIELPFNWVDAFAVERNGKYLYLAVRDPYPRVVKYEVSIKDSAG